jgi:hypothetical protein
MVYERVVWVRKGKRWAWDQSNNATRLSGENDAPGREAETGRPDRCTAPEPRVYESRPFGIRD